MWLEIKNCLECIDCLTFRTRSDDWFELAYDYYCGHSDLEESKLIQAYVEHNEKITEIPEWCPRRR